MALVRKEKSNTKTLRPAVLQKPQRGCAAVRMLENITDDPDSCVGGAEDTEDCEGL